MSSDGALETATPQPATDVLQLRRLVDKGGVYIPPNRRRALEQLASKLDKNDEVYQQVHWQALQKSINGIVNKVNSSNIKHIIPELFHENLLRGRGLFCQSLMTAQLASIQYIPVFAALVAIVNTHFPEIGELLLTRLIVDFRKSFARSNQKV